MKHFKITLPDGRTDFQTIPDEDAQTFLSGFPEDQQPEEVDEIVLDETEPPFWTDDAWDAYAGLAVKTQRDQKLSETDYLMVADYPISAELRAAWVAYRQALRDLPSTAAVPSGIVWPQSPATP